MMNSLNPLCTMKTNKLIAAALLPLLFSCAKENIEPSTDPVSDEKYVTVNLVPDEDSITKATYDDEKGIIWQPGGKAGIISAKDDYYILEESKPLELIKIYDFEDPANKDIKSAQASFDFVLGIADDYKGYFKFFYPYHSEAKVTKGDNPYIRIPFSVDPNQTSGVGKSSDNFAVVSKDMLQLDQTNHDTPAVTYYKVVGSYIRFLVYGKPGEKVKSISIKSAQKPSGLYFVNGGNNDLTGEPYANDGEIVTVSVSEDYTTPATISDAKGIYASVLPERALKNTYTVRTDKGWYEFESKKEAVFKFGYIKDVPLNLEHANCKDLDIPTELYIVGDACESGWDASKAVKMDKGENNTFTAELFLQKGKEGFKLLTRKGFFEDCFVNDGNDNMVYYTNPTGDTDKKFNVPGFGLYKVTADFNTGKLTCEAQAPYLVSDFTSYHIGQNQPLQMSPTETPGVFKAEKVLIYNKPYEENGQIKHFTNQFKFAFKKTDAKDIDYTFSIQPDNSGNYEIAMGKEYYEKGNSKEDFLSKTFNTRFVGISGSLGTIKNDSEGKEIDYKWSVKETYNKKYYDVTLNLNENKLTLTLHQGTKYKLVGINNIWDERAPETTVNSDGLAIWTLDVDINTGNWGANENDNGKYTFKICGENTTIEGNFWDGEWYYAQLDESGSWWWNGSTYGKETPVLFESVWDRKWRMTESGNYTFVFDTKNLTFKVTKNN